jgi:hypothetical protein
MGITQASDRKMSLAFGGGTLTVNSRARSYTYHQTEIVRRDNFKYVVVPDGFSAYYAECLDYSQDITGTITEDYTTVDCTFHYVDLRTDLLVYTESTQEMKFTQTNNGGVNKTGSRYGNLVYLATGYDDVWRVPFILEEVPITITNKIICTAFDAPLNTETINSGYWNGVRVLMPLFNGGVPRHDMITIGGVTYDAFDVDWYYIDEARRTADGDSFFWWADWHKAVGVNNAIDADEARKLADSYLGLVTPVKIPSSNGVITSDFMGSAAVDKDNNLFFSTSFDTQSGKIVLSKLVVAGVETPIPQEEFREDSQHATYYPVAPL